MNDFVQQCRREWKRLRVPDSVADEMAAELAADLNEAEADNISARELLGNAASDPRSFAASWAAERAVIPPRHLRARLSGRSLLLAAIVALTVTATGAALVLFASEPAAAPVAAGRVAAEFSGPRPPGPLATIVVVPPPAFESAPASATVWVRRGERVVFAQQNESALEINRIGSILLIAGLVGVTASMLFLLWPSRTRNDWSGRDAPVSAVPPGPA